MTRRWADKVMATGQDAIRLVELAHRPGSATVVMGSRLRGAPKQATLAGRVQGISVVEVDPETVSAETLDSAEHIVLDASALPQRVAFGILCELLEGERTGRFQGQLQVVFRVAPSAPPSRRPGDGEPVLMSFPPRVGASGGPGTGRSLRVWVPVLAEGNGDELTAIYRYVDPDEVCPVLPFPARDARRADNLVLEHRDLLFDRMGIDVGDIIYAHESDPFDLYRVLAGLHDRLARSSAPPAPCATLFVSPGRSPVTALGSFLAAYECGFALVWMGSDEAPVPRLSDDDELSCVWLAGDPYGVGPGVA